MISIAKNIVFQRWDNLPQNLRDVLCLEENAIVLQKVAQDEHLPPQKFKDFSRIAGYVILGFVHPEDLARNLEESLHLPPQTAKNIQTALLNNIFNAYKEDLDKVYNPLSEKDFGLKPDRRQDNRGPAPLPTTAPRPVTLKVEGSIPAPKISGTNIPKPAPIVSGPPTPSAPFSFNKKQESQPINTPQDFKLRASIPTPQRTSVPTPPPTKPAQVELGRINVALENKQSSGKIDIGREPIKYSEPKSIFMPPAPPKPTIPTPPPRPENKTISPPPVPSPIPPPPIKK